jgi:hypothetical protein
VVICQNPRCKKTFPTPLKTINLQENPAEPYLACPYCLTKISEETETPANDLASKIAQIQEEMKQAEANPKPPVCHQHLGYLSERISKEQVPEECLTCKNMVDCMLRKMKE